MTTNIKYLCIDDQQRLTIDPLLGALSKSGIVAFDRVTPQNLEAQLPAISQFVESHKGHNGLLLDLRLDEDADSDGNRVAYRGPTLAQELRTRMSEGAIEPFPIVLWSVNTKFEKTYLSDESSHDLFDDVFGKDDEILANPARVSVKLASLANGYAKLKGIKTSDGMERLGLSDNQESPVYLQFRSEYLSIVDNRGAHEVALFLQNKLIKVEGLLVTEHLLAARFGVDIESSAEEWRKLIDAISSTSYKGPFSEGWSRWWWFRLEDWWAELNDEKVDLRRSSAQERVARLNAALGLKLQNQKAIHESYSTKFFTVCLGTGKPLDPLNGLRVISQHNRSWLDPGYVSIHAALERINKKNWRLDPLEQGRLARIKAEGSPG